MKVQPAKPAINHMFPATKLTAALAVTTALTLAGVPAAFADTSWISTSSGTWSTAANWSAGVPSTAPTGAVFNDNSAIQHILDLAGTGRVAIGVQFNAGTGASGFTFNSSANPGPGLFLRAGGTVNGMQNNDTFTQNINVPVKLTSNSGIAGAGAAMVFNAASGGFSFNGTNQSSAPWSINLNGASSLTFTGSGNITVGGSATSGSIVNTNTGANGGLIKSGTGVLTLTGTGANTFIGTNIINQGILLAGKADALGSGNVLTLNGGTFQNGANLSQTLGVLNLTALSTLDLGSGTSTEAFANSSGQNWAGNELDILNWTALRTLRFGTDSSGLTAAQLLDIVFPDYSNAHGQIDGSGFLSPLPVPEPSTAAVGLIGGIGLLVGYFQRRNRK